MGKIKILYVEDEPALASIVKDTLEMQSFEVHFFNHGQKALEQFIHLDFNICILDVMLPGLDGFSLGKTIKKAKPDTPIIYLTAKNQTQDVLEGFQSGGNDYLKKPFSIEELIARIHNLVGLTSEVKSEEKVLDTISSFEFNFDHLTLRSEDHIHKLSHKEAQLIKHFSQNRNSIIEKKNLLILYWGDDSFYNGRSLDVYIKKLRDYFASDNKIQLLTLRGVGYRFVVDG